MMCDASISVYQNIFYLVDSVYPRKLNICWSHTSQNFLTVFLGGEKEKKWKKNDTEKP